MSPMLQYVDIVLVCFSCHCLHFEAQNQHFLYSRVQLWLAWWGMKEAHLIPAQFPLSAAELTEYVYLHM